MSEKTLIQQLKASEPRIEEVISTYIPAEGTKKAALDFVAWLNINKIPPTWLDIGEQNALAWIAERSGKKLFMVWDGKDVINFMVQGVLTDDHQTFILENNLQTVVLDNLCYCSRKDGEHCTGCDLPPDVAGVNVTILGKEVENFCCGHMVSFSNPNSETIEGIKKLLDF